MFRKKSNGDYSYIEIIEDKYLYLSEIALKGICNKFNIPLDFRANGYDIAKQIIPQTFISENFLNNFYHRLSSSEKKILKFIVNSNDHTIEKDVKKKFHYSIVLMVKDDVTAYVWWLEPFIVENEFEVVYKEIFLEFLSEGRSQKKSKKVKNKNIGKSENIVNSCEKISDIVVHKLTSHRQLISKPLEELHAQDTIHTLKIIYALSSDSKINVTQKGTINLRNERVIKEKIGEDYNFIWLINFLTISGYLSFTKSRMPTVKFHVLMAKDDVAIIKTFFELFMNSKQIYELMFMDFYNTTNEHESVPRLRKMVFDLLIVQEPSLWINIDYIVDRIKIDAKTLALVTDGYDYAYGFYGNSFRTSYNKIEHLNVVLRYFVKNFVAFVNYFGLCDIASTQENLYHKDDIVILGKYDLDARSSAIEYYRFSELGKYILGMANSYKNIQDYQLILNEFRLEVKVENANNLSEIFLEKIASKVDSQRYRVDMKSFMKNINSHMEYKTIHKTLESKSKVLPNNWKSFFDLLDKRVDGAAIVSRDTVLIQMKNDKEILKLIASQSRLKEKILKADGFHIVVLEKDLSFVKRVFKEFGIII